MDGAMFVAIPCLVNLGVRKPEIGREINDPQVIRQCRNHILRRAVRQTTEYCVNLVPIGVGDLDQVRRGEVGEIWKYGREWLPGMTLASQYRQLVPIMTRDQAQKFAP
jgi:hypothetical protein